MHKLGDGKGCKASEEWIDHDAKAEVGVGDVVGKWKEDEWQHEQIRLEPLNPAHSPWDVDPEGFAVVAEWLRVLE